MFKQLSLFRKLILANVFYAIPVLVLVYLMVSSKNVNIDFAAWELKGDLYQRPAETLLELISEHKLLAQRLAYGDKSVESSLKEVGLKVDDAFKDLYKVNDDIGEDLQFSDEGLAKRNRIHLKPATVEAKWKSIQSKVGAAKASEINEAHTSLIADIRGIITHSGDTSNLILDPDLDSYYLMDITLLALPQMQDRLQDITANIEPILHRRSISPEERINLAVYSAMLKQADLDRVMADLQTIITEDPNFYGESPTLNEKLKPSLEQLSEKVTKAVEVINLIANSERVTVSPSEFLKTMAEARAQSYTSWKVAVDELDVLLNTRLSNLTSNKWWSLVWAVFALLISCSILLGVARSFNRNMTHVLTELKKSLLETQASSLELVNVSTDLSSSSNQQAAAIQETVSSLDEINSMLSKTLDGAQHSNEEAHRSHLTAVKGQDSVGQMSNAMGEIAQSNDQIMKQIEASNQQISEITKIIGEIAGKTKVINDIVFQTKLLSFNASVEAARAGEHGKGFAVVAEEVGSLAQMSGSAAQEIAGMVESSIQRVDGIVANTKASVEALIRQGRVKVDDGKEISVQCSNVLGEIVGAVGSVRENVDQITQAAQEQSKGVNEITRAMHELDKVTHQNAVMSQKTAQYSERLTSQAKFLEDLVSGLEREVLGRTISIEMEVKRPRQPAEKSATQVKLSRFGDESKAKGSSVSSLRAIDSNAKRHH